MTETHVYNIKISNTLKDHYIVMDEFPDLRIKYIKGINMLCPSYFSDKIKCISAGYLELILSVDERELVLKSNYYKPIDIVVDGYTYSFQSEGIEVKNKSRDQTYISIKISKSIPIYKLGKTFTIKFYENGSTGYQLKVTTSDGLKIISDAYVPGCGGRPVPGCGGEHVYTFIGISKGKHQIIGLRGRSWEPETMKSQVYDVIIL